jgi:hypothetical protein
VSFVCVQSWYCVILVCTHRHVGICLPLIYVCAQTGVAKKSTLEMRARLLEAGVEVVTSQLLTDARDDSREDAASYLKKHNINLLMEKLVTSLVFSQPENPREFLIGELGDIANNSRCVMYGLL